MGEGWKETRRLGNSRCRPKPNLEGSGLVLNRWPHRVIDLKRSRPPLATHILILVRPLAGLDSDRQKRTRGGSEIPPALEPLETPHPRIHSMSLTESPPLSSGRSQDLTEVEGSGEAPSSWLRAASLHVVCFAILTCASYLAYAFVTPRWRTTGYPSYIGYGKNVEQAALGLTILGVTSFVILARRLAISLTALIWLAIALALIKTYYAGGLAAALLLGVAAAITLYFTWHGRLQDPVGADARDEVPKWHWWTAALLLPVVAASLFLTMFRPAPALDLFHDGEVIASALDLLDGGVPYRTFFWPHGVSDSGLAALIIGLTGNEGMGSILILRAITVTVGFIGLFLLTLGLTRQPLSSLLFAAMVGSLSKAPTYVATRSFFPILAFLLISLRFRFHRIALFGVGLLLGTGYVWRIETALFGLATLIIYLFIDRYYAQGYALDGQVWRHLWDLRKAAGLVGDGLILMLGVASSLVIIRQALGFPTVEWFRTTLIDLPRYHSDSTGLPLPLAWKGVEYSGFKQVSPLQHKLMGMILLPGFLLLALNLYSSTLYRGVERRLALSTFQGRFFTLLVIYLLFTLKTFMDRSNFVVIKETSWLPFIIVGINFLAILEGRFRRAPILLGSLALGCALLAVLAAARPDLLPRFRPPGPANLATLRDRLRPTETPEEMLGPTTSPDAGEILRGVKQVKELLDAQSVGERQLLIYHSAAQLFPLLGRKVPSKFWLSCRICG